MCDLKLKYDDILTMEGMMFKLVLNDPIPFIVPHSQKYKSLHRWRTGTRYQYLVRWSTSEYVAAWFVPLVKEYSHECYEGRWGCCCEISLCSIWCYRYIVATRYHNSIVPGSLCTLVPGTSWLPVMHLSLKHHGWSRRYHVLCVLAWIF